MFASVVLCLRLYRAVGRQGSVVTGKSILSFLSAFIFAIRRARAVLFTPALLAFSVERARPIPHTGIVGRVPCVAVAYPASSRSGI